MKDKISILHISDLHLENPDKANTFRNQLENDLKQDLEIEKLDFIVVSGDIGNKSTPEEYQAAETFFNTLMENMGTERERLIIVPGNHDLNWKISRNEGYDFIYRVDYDGKFDENIHIKVNDDIIQIRKPEKYMNRFRHFIDFYEKITGIPYPMDVREQGIVQFFNDEKILFLGLNSSHELDHHFTQRSGIDGEAITYGLDQIDRMGCEDFLKIAVCHHPVSGMEMMKPDFLERLFQCRFHVLLHGHIHEAKHDFYHYDPKREIYIVGAGTFGVQTKEDMVQGIPHQYNLLLYSPDENRIEVKTRKKDRPEGAWSADARWGDKNHPDPFYTFEIKRKAQSTGTGECLPGTISRSATLDIPRGYHRWVGDQCKYMDVNRIRERGTGITVSLPEVFVPLYANKPGMKKETDKEAGLMGERDRTTDIEDLIVENDYLLVEGEAGSGKTTLVKHMALMMLNEGEYKGLSGWLPLLVFLKDFRDFPWDGHHHNAETALELLDYFSKRNGCHLRRETMEAYINEGRALLLLDGLDEIEDEMRDAVAKSFANLFQRQDGNKLCWMGRPHGIDGQVLDIFGDKKTTIYPLNEEQQKSFIYQWFKGVEGAESIIGKKTAEGMISEIKDNPGVDNLKDNPLMLTAICILYYDENELPGQRAELYDKFVDNMLYRRFSDPKKVFQYLISLAQHIHSKRRKGIDKQTAIEILSKTYPAKDLKGLEYKDYLETEFNRIEPGCGLLQFKGGELMFRHLMFQEYLTAAAIKGNALDFTKAIENFWEDDWHREVVQLYIGLHSVDNNRNLVKHIIESVLDNGDKPPYTRWRLAARSLLDIHEDKRDIDTVDIATEKMRIVIVSEAPPKDRADAGEILGRLADRRDLEAFVEIPGGKYKLSTGAQKIKTFEMSKYPVTNQWYQKFIEADGYENKEFWTPEGLKWLEYTGHTLPMFWHDRTWNCPNHPVVGVCWYEAVAFCNWLNKSRNDKYTYRLPTENEWEAAAAGKDGRKYPFGEHIDENKCNYDRNIGRTTAVGIYPHGKTPEGLEDMAGNVWEWTISNYHTKSVLEDFYFDPEMQKLYDQYLKAKGEEEEELRKLIISKLNEENRQLPVLRGGSWDDPSGSLRCGNRYWLSPFGRDDNIGVRLVRT